NRFAAASAHTVGGAAARMGDPGPSPTWRCNRNSGRRDSKARSLVRPGLGGVAGSSSGPYAYLWLPRTQIRAYRWCSPPRIGCAIMSPNRWIGRVRGAPPRAHRWVRGWARGCRSMFVFPVVSPFRLRVSHDLAHATFPAPPRRTQHADFLALRSPVCFASMLMGPILLERLSAAGGEPCSC